MDKIRLLYVENVITRKKRQLQQDLYFFMLIENISYSKQVDVIWSGEDGVWQTLPAHYHSKLSDDKEYWCAQISHHLTPTQSLPGNIRFGLRYRALGKDYWDNKHDHNYSSQADSGIKLAQPIALQNIAFGDKLAEGQKFVPITVAVNQSLAAENITIHWTTDNWRHSKTTACHYKRNYWDKTLLSNARNPNQYGVQIWKGWLKVSDAFRVQYSISCESEGRVVWDNNHGNNYQVARKPLNVLILNLHCYQEDNQDYKFSQIAKAINELGVDVVCLQEVAELWNDGMGDWNSNSARIINELLDKPYYIQTDWSHLGFDRYREGVAILSRYPICNHDSCYVSDSHDAYSIHSRKVVMAAIEAPGMGLINVFSAHLSWWEDGFADQFTRLRNWASDKQNEQVNATLLCGDFNVAAGSKGYQLVLDSNEYDDQYLAAKTDGRSEQNFRISDPYWQHYLADDYRIDYIFMNKNSNLHVVSARSMFTEQDYGRVSDHSGYLMTFEPK
ncbi:MAG: endonuclease/exonuclease/phosphatase family protein [Methylococcaceae bacterium]